MIEQVSPEFAGLAQVTVAQADEPTTATVLSADVAAIVSVQVLPPSAVRQTAPLPPRGSAHHEAVKQIAKGDGGDDRNRDRRGLNSR